MEKVLGRTWFLCFWGKCYDLASWLYTSFPESKLVHTTRGLRRYYT